MYRGRCRTPSLELDAPTIRALQPVDVQDAGFSSKGTERFPLLALIDIDRVINGTFKDYVYCWREWWELGRLRIPGLLKASHETWYRGVNVSKKVPLTPIKPRTPRMKVRLAGIVALAEHLTHREDEPATKERILTYLYQPKETLVRKLNDLCREGPIADYSFPTVAMVEPVGYDGGVLSRDCLYLPRLTDARLVLYILSRMRGGFVFSGRRVVEGFIEGMYHLKDYRVHRVCFPEMVGSK